MRLSQLRALCVEAIRRHNVGLVVIDHWKYLSTDRTFRNPNDEDEEKARFLKQDLAKELNVAVVCLAHTTKGADQREDRRPRMNDLRGSGFVAAHADFISFVHRPFKHASPADVEDGRVKRTDAEMLWEKTRHSVEGAADFYFDPSTMTVR
jgi:replicative DNA helicase